jgi:hypothetical protein
MNCGFFVRHFTERGTEVAIYDYAKYNEELLHNKSYIICFTEKKQCEIGFPVERHSYDKFNNRFEIIEICDIDEMTFIIDRYKLHFFYTLTYGGPGDIYKFENKEIWGKCKTIKHCVFDTTFCESDYYIAIANYLNSKYNTNFNVIPHMVTLPSCEENLRTELNIPQDAIVLGRHGGFAEFNISIAHKAIIDFLNLENSSNVWFLFMNTHEFYKHPRIIYLDRTTDLIFKTKFINTCDAMIHARDMGEIFPLSIAEFSSKNKPIITCPIGDLGHIEILGDKAVLYSSKDELLNIFNNIKNIIKSKDDWNAYRQYTPENVMRLFDELIFSKVI